MLCFVFFLYSISIYLVFFVLVQHAVFFQYMGSLYEGSISSLGTTSHATHVLLLCFLCCTTCVCVWQINWLIWLTGNKRQRVDLLERKASICPQLSHLESTTGGLEHWLHSNRLTSSMKLEEWRERYRTRSNLRSFKVSRCATCSIIFQDTAICAYNDFLR